MCHNLTLDRGFGYQSGCGAAFRGGGACARVRTDCRPTGGRQMELDVSRMGISYKSLLIPISTESVWCVDRAALSLRRCLAEYATSPLGGMCASRYALDALLHRNERQPHWCHSLRAGGATALKIAGADDLTIRKYGRWRSSTFEDYIHEQIQLFAKGWATKMAVRTPYINVGATRVLPAAAAA